MTAKNTPVQNFDDEPIRIAYIDDDLELTRLVQDILEEEGFDVFTENNGEDGLAAILAGQPDLIILDVMMPGMTGWEIAKYIRSKPDWDETPILMLTGIGEQLNAMTSELYGADAAIDKPFDLDELIDTVHVLLGSED